MRSIQIITNTSLYGKTSTVFGFNIEYNKKIYTVSIHNFLPIMNRNDIFKYPLWNELIIYNANSADTKTLIVKQTALKKSLRKLDNIVIKTLSSDINAVFDSIIEDTASPLVEDIKCTYIKINNSTKGNFIGCPVFNNNKLIGIISKQLTKNVSLVLPTLYIIKTIEREINIYKPNGIVTKMNDHLVKDDFIFNKSFKTNIGIASNINLQSSDSSANIVDRGVCLEIYDDPFFTNKLDKIIINNDTYYKINILTISFLFHFVSHSIADKVIHKYDSKNDKYINIKDNRLSIYHN